MKRTTILIAVLVVAAVAVMAVMLLRREKISPVYVGSSMRVPMEQCLDAYKKLHPDADIRLDFGDSGEVLSKVEFTGRGEAAVLHEPYITKAKRDGWGTKTHVLANMQPVIVVAKGNPKGVTGLKDFTRDDLHVGVTDARYTTSGQIVQQALANAGIREQVMARDDLVQNRSSGYMCLQVEEDALDAITCWDAVARGRADRVDIVPIEPAFMPHSFIDSEVVTYTDGRVSVGLIELKTAQHPESTADFVRFILSPEGQAIWAKCGFNPAVESPASQP